MDFAKDIRIAENQRNIRERAAKIEILHEKLKEIEIIEEEVIVDGREILLFRIEGQGAGVAMDKRDILSGEMTREDGYLSLTDMIGEAPDA